MNNFYVIAFESTHHAIMVEKRLKKEFEIDTIPTPREISASCGLSIKFSIEDFNNIVNKINEINIKKELMVIYSIEKTKEEKIVKKIKWGSIDGIQRNI